jgi:MFS family permease
LLSGHAEVGCGHSWSRPRIYSFRMSVAEVTQPATPVSEGPEVTPVAGVKKGTPEWRAKWDASPEYRSLRRSYGWIGLAGFALTVLGVAIGYGVTPVHFGRDDKVLHSVYGAVAGLVVAYVTAWRLIGSARRHWQRVFEDRMATADALRAAESGISAGSTTFTTLWTATQARLDYYHKIATTQSERSFQYGQYAAAAGFAIVVIAVVLAAFSKSAPAAIASAVTGLAGGGLGGYIGATFMKTQESSAAQLRAYFDQPLEFSRALAAERLITLEGGLSAQDRAAAVRDLAQAVAPSSRAGNAVASSDGAGTQ